MTYQITPEQAKILKEKIERNLPSWNLLLNINEVGTNRFSVGIPNTTDSFIPKHIQNELESALTQLSDRLYISGSFEFKEINCYQDMRVSYFPDVSTDAHSARTKVNNMLMWVEKLDKSSKLGVNLYSTDEEQKVLEDCLLPFDMEWLEKVVKEELSKPVVTEEEVLKFAENFLKDQEDKLKPTRSAEKHDCLAQFNEVGGVEEKSPVSCFTIGAIGAFIVFALGFIVSTNL